MRFQFWLVKYFEIFESMWLISSEIFSQVVHVRMAVTRRGVKPEVYPSYQIPNFIPKFPSQTIIFLPSYVYEPPAC